MEERKDRRIRTGSSKGEKSGKKCTNKVTRKNVLNDLEVPSQLLDQLYKQNLSKNIA
jgi:hypothetical protein